MADNSDPGDPKTEHIYDADALIEAEEDEVTRTLADADPVPEDERLDISQEGDDSIAGTKEAEAWTPGHDA
jgi:hypothetical protein